MFATSVSTCCWSSPICADICLNSLQTSVSYHKAFRSSILGFFEVVATVGRIVALERQVPATLARRLPIALDFPALALIASSR
jgi:hypothetical protein